MIVEIFSVVGGVAAASIMVGYGVVRIASVCCTAMDTYDTDDDLCLEVDEIEDDEDEG